ncbi:60S ribosomal protein L27B [Hanseniaspora uvarum]|nr:ribosomal 60S subunit protein L27B [Hanseniaspora uvarum]
MAKFLNTGKVAVVVRGRYAGKKVVILTAKDDGSKSHKFGHAIVAGIERQPGSITKKMGAKKVAKRSKVKAFIKVINYNHLLPTRYTLNASAFQNAVSAETFEQPEQRKEAKKTVKAAFEEINQSGKSKWFFSKLNF